MASRWPRASSGSAGLIWRGKKGGRCSEAQGWPGLRVCAPTRPLAPHKGAPALALGVPTAKPPPQGSAPTLQGPATAPLPAMWPEGASKTQAVPSGRATHCPQNRAPLPARPHLAAVPTLTSSCPGHPRPATGPSHSCAATANSRTPAAASSSRRQPGHLLPCPPVTPVPLFSCPLGGGLLGRRLGTSGLMGWVSGSHLSAQFWGRLYGPLADRASLDTAGHRWPWPHLPRCPLHAQGQRGRPSGHSS